MKSFVNLIVAEEKEPRTWERPSWKDVKISRRKGSVYKRARLNASYNNIPSSGRFWHNHCMFLT
jgi:hypothetical protein